MLYPLAADPTTVLIAFITGHASLSPLVGTRVSTYKIDTPLTRIQLTMVPPETSEPGFENYEYQVDCWGPTDAVNDIDQAQNRRLQRRREVRQLGIGPIGGQHVLHEVVGPDREEVRRFGQAVGHDRGRRHLDHHPELDR